MKWLKVGGVIVFAVLITALGIDASDTFTGSRNTLLGQLISSENGAVCPQGMVEVAMALSFTCVDAYEVSASADCPQRNPSNELQTKENMDTQKCAAISAPEVDPWRFITREQAVAACVKVGKRLPKSDEWYLMSVGTPDTGSACNIDGAGVHRSGSHEQCVSSVGAFDAIGNAWEWTADDVIGGMFQGRPLPEAGYVTQVDINGVPTLTNAKASELFNKDYLWSSSDGAFGMLRGGFYGSNDDAGIYAVHAQTLPTAAGTAIGFRCVK